MMIFLGIDLHKRYSVITAVDQEGEILARQRLPNDEAISPGRSLKELPAEPIPCR